MSQTFNIVFIGHVDSGKSTLCGQILIKNGQVEKRLLEKYEKIAKENNRPNWYIAYLFDTDAEEREKGKTIDVGVSSFNTNKRTYTILDAPGHRNYVPNMISGVSQADIAVLNISVKSGEFESGFELDGQTKEHTIIAKTFGIDNIVICLNKMDTINWNEERYKYIEGVLIKYLKKIGYKNYFILPVSGYMGDNISEPLKEGFFPYYKERKSLFEIFDQIVVEKKTIDRPRGTVISTIEDNGNLFIWGKVISGKFTREDKLFCSPLKIALPIQGLTISDEERKSISQGDVFCLKTDCQIDVKIGDLIGIESDIPPYVIAVNSDIFIHQLLENKIFSAGYKCIMHIHNLQVECEIHSLKGAIYLKSEQNGNVTISFPKPISCETFKDFPPLSKFLLRDEGKTIAIGKVLKTFSHRKNN